MPGNRPTSLLAAASLLAGGLWLALSGSHQTALVDASAQAKAFAVTAAFSDPDVLRNEQTVLSGTVKPVPSRKRLLVQRATDSGWTTVAHRKVKSDGTYRYAFKPQQSGTWTYRTRMPKVGTVRAGNSPDQVLAVATEALVVFHIPADTGAGSWNTQDTKVVANVGDTLRIVNDDSVGHEAHTNGTPFPHPANEIAPGSSADYALYDTFTGWLYCHTHGQGSQFWIDVLQP